MGDSTPRRRTRRKTRPRLRVVKGGRHAPTHVDTETSIPTREEMAAVRERWALDGFDEVDRAMLSILANKPSITDRELGVAVGLARETTNRRKNRPAFQAALEDLQLQPLAIFVRNQARAARTLGRLLDSKDEQVAVRAAIEHLKPLLKDDRAGEGSEAEVFAKFLEEAYSFRDTRKSAPAPAIAPTKTTAPA